MEQAASRVVDEVERVRRVAPWRHPSRLSAVVWLYLGAGGVRIWSEGVLVEPRAGMDEDWPYLAEGLAEGLPPPVRGAAARAAYGMLAGLMPTPRETVSALHSRDFVPPSDMPVLRLPYVAVVEHLAGALIACHVMLACAPLTIEPAAARRAENRRRFTRGLHLVVSIVEARGLEREVRAAAEVLMEGVAVRDGAGRIAFADPILTEE